MVSPQFEQSSNVFAAQLVREPAEMRPRQHGSRKANEISIQRSFLFSFFSFLFFLGEMMAKKEHCVAFLLLRGEPPTTQ